ncbi:MAG: hypothetical protein ABI183_07280 [Polyangiaceae bacterium]
MPEENKKFPPPRSRVVAPYRQAAPTPPPRVVDAKSLTIVAPPEQHDLLDELEKVEIDPRVLEEARSSNRAWGGAMIAFGLFSIILSIALEISVMHSHISSRSAFYLPGLGIMSLAYGIRRWRMHGIEY